MPKTRLIKREFRAYLIRIGKVTTNNRAIKASTINITTLDKRQEHV